uniref:HAUS augmin-like complex subunit 6 N-terminal domain-containing protein n=1 Tax=Mola mola TaxID=94237 RepID=A0A3Q4BAT2_MOLML
MMANPAVLQKRNGEYLWFSLIGLGFQPDVATSSIAGKSNINVKHINLGPNMFDKPNKDAFYIVTHFLLEKLNPSRFCEVCGRGRYCWPVLNHKADAEFRKVTCSWLREIMVSRRSKVVASLFLSPGGSRFISLMLNLANHVMLQEMKKFTTDGSWVPETAAIPTSSLYMARRKHDLISARFLKTAVDQDRFLHEYQRRAQVLVKSTMDLRAEGSKYDELLKYVTLELITGSKPRRVRSLWSAIDAMLSSTKEGQHAVESVLKGDVDQYVLDGTDRVLTIPRSLLERVEKLPHQLSSGQVYKDGQLNLLCVMELMNHALQLLREERRKISNAPKLNVSPTHLQEKYLTSHFTSRQKVSKEAIPEVRISIQELEAAWDRKWMDTVKDTPLVSFLSDDPALGFLSPMAPLSFEPAAEASGSVFSWYPATLPSEQGTPGEHLPGLFHINFPCYRNSSDKPPLTDLCLDLKASVRKTTRVQPKVGSSRTRTQILDLECENLADQFAEAVTASPSDGRAKGLDLEGLLGTLHGDPFSTRKQLPRTPESLIQDVKSSWRKALEEDEAQRLGRVVVVNDSASGRLAPLDEASESPVPPAGGITPVSQQGVSSLKVTQLWDTFHTDALDSSAVHFTLDHETLPELPSCDSLLSLDDELQSPPRSARHRLTQQLCDSDSFVEGRRRVSGHAGSALDRDWLKEPAKPAESADKVFSLDLETLSPQKTQEYSLPKLITFSPIDDMKC